MEHITKTIKQNPNKSTDELAEILAEYVSSLLAAKDVANVDPKVYARYIIEKIQEDIK
jgi:hypothetical protein